MMLSVIPSERYSASGSALALMNGSTARESIACLFVLTVSLISTSVSAPERSVSFTSSIRHLLHLGGEAVAAARDGLDVLMLGKSTTQGKDVAGEVVLFDNDIRPDPPHQLFLVDDVTASANQRQESFIDFRFEQ